MKEHSSATTNINSKTNAHDRLGDGLFRKKLKNGKLSGWYCWIRRADGKWHQLSLQTRNYIKAKQDRQQKIDEFRAKENRENGTTIPTLQEYFENTFTPGYLRSGVRPSTSAAYKGAFNNHIIPVLGSVPLDKLTKSQIKDFISLLTTQTYLVSRTERTINASGKIVKKRVTVERPFSRAAIRVVVASLCAVLNHAVDNEVIASNPAGRLSKHYKQAPVVHAIQPLTASEVPIFLGTVREHFPNYYVMFLTLFHTGVRSGECAGLKWDDLDFNTKLITVRRTITPSGIANTKTDRIRKVDLSDDLSAELQAHQQRSREKWSKAHPNDKPENFPVWVFANQEGGPPDMHNIKTRVFKNALTKAGLREIRMHDTRHSYASILLNAGISPAYVQRQLGHESIKLTLDTYYSYIPGSGRDALKFLPASLPATTQTAV